MSTGHVSYEKKEIQEVEKIRFVEFHYSSTQEQLNITATD